MYQDLNVYVDTGTSHKYSTLCLCAQKRKRKRAFWCNREKIFEIKGQSWREDYTAN